MKEDINMAHAEETDTVVETEKQDSEQTTEENVDTEVDVKDEEIQEINEVTQLQQQLDEETNRHLRLRADYENFKRRTQLDREAADKYKAQNLLTNLLPVLDNFERAMQNAPANEDSQSLQKGLDMVYKTLVEATEKEGLQVIVAEGVAFDPTVHQAVMTETDESRESGIILQELQKGYRYKDRVLRPSMVKVNE